MLRTLASAAANRASTVTIVSSRAPKTRTDRTVRSRRCATGIMLPNATRRPGAAYASLEGLGKTAPSRVPSTFTAPTVPTSVSATSEVSAATVPTGSVSAIGDGLDIGVSITARPTRSVRTVRSGASARRESVAIRLPENAHAPLGFREQTVISGALKDLMDPDASCIASVSMESVIRKPASARASRDSSAQTAQRHAPKGSTESRVSSPARAQMLRAPNKQANVSAHLAQKVSAVIKSVTPTPLASCARRQLLRHRVLPQIPRMESACRVHRALRGSIVSITVPLGAMAMAVSKCAPVPTVMDVIRRPANASVSPVIMGRRAPRSVPMGSMDMDVLWTARNVHPDLLVIISTDYVSARRGSKELSAHGRALQDSGGMGVGRCAGVRQSTSNAMHRLENAVVRRVRETSQSQFFDYFEKKRKF